MITCQMKGWFLRGLLEEAERGSALETTPSRSSCPLSIKSPVPEAMVKDQHGGNGHHHIRGVWLWVSMVMHAAEVTGLCHSPEDRAAERLSMLILKISVSTGECLVSIRASL